MCQSIRSQPAVAFFVANTYYILTLLVLYDLIDLSVAKWQCKIWKWCLSYSLLNSIRKAWCFVMILCLSEILPVIWVRAIWGLNHECQSGVVTKIAAPVDVSENSTQGRLPTSLPSDLLRRLRMGEDDLPVNPSMSPASHAPRNLQDRAFRPRTWHSHVTSLWPYTIHWWRFRCWKPKKDICSWKKLICNIAY